MSKAVDKEFRKQRFEEMMKRKPVAPAPTAAVAPVGDITKEQMAQRFTDVMTQSKKKNTGEPSKVIAQPLPNGGEQDQDGIDDVDTKIADVYSKVRPDLGAPQPTFNDFFKSGVGAVGKPPVTANTQDGGIANLFTTESYNDGKQQEFVSDIKKYYDTKIAKEYKPVYQQNGAAVYASGNSPDVLSPVGAELKKEKEKALAAVDKKMQLFAGNHTFITQNYLDANGKSFEKTVAIPNDKVLPTLPGANPDPIIKESKEAFERGKAIMKAMNPLQYEQLQTGLKPSLEMSAKLSGVSAKFAAINDKLSKLTNEQAIIVDKYNKGEATSEEIASLGKVKDDIDQVKVLQQTANEIEHSNPIVRTGLLKKAIWNTLANRYGTSPQFGWNDPLGVQGWNKDQFEAVVSDYKKTLTDPRDIALLNDIQEQKNLDLLSNDNQTWAAKLTGQFANTFVSTAKFLDADVLHNWIPNLLDPKDADRRDKAQMLRQLKEGEAAQNDIDINFSPDNKKFFLNEYVDADPKSPTFLQVVKNEGENKIGDSLLSKIAYTAAGQAGQLGGQIAMSMMLPSFGRVMAEGFMTGETAIGAAAGGFSAATGYETLKALNFATKVAIPAFAMTYDSNYQQSFDVVGTKTPWKNGLYASLNAAFEGGTELLGNPLAQSKFLVSAFKKDVGEFVKNLTWDEMQKMGKEEFKVKLKSALKETGKAILKGGAEAAGESNEEALNDALTGITQAIFNPNYTTANQVITQAGQTWLQTFAGMGFMPVAGAYSGMKNGWGSKLTQNAISTIAKNQAAFVDQINNSVKDKSITQDEANEKINIVNTSAEALRDTKRAAILNVSSGGKAITSENADALVMARANEIHLSKEIEKAKKSDDAVLQVQLEDKKKQFVDLRTSIIKDELFFDPVTGTPQVPNIRIAPIAFDGVTTISGKKETKTKPAYYNGEQAISKEEANKIIDAGGDISKLEVYNDAETTAKLVAKGGTEGAKNATRQEQADQQSKLRGEEISRPINLKIDETDNQTGAANKQSDQSTDAKVKPNEAVGENIEGTAAKAESATPAAVAKIKKVKGQISKEFEKRLVTVNDWLDTENTRLRSIFNTIPTADFVKEYEAVKKTYLDKVQQSIDEAKEMEDAFNALFDEENPPETPKEAKPVSEVAKKETQQSSTERGEREEKPEPTPAASTNVREGERVIDDNELSKIIGNNDVVKQLKKAEEQLGEGVVNRDRLIETAKRIQKADKKDKLLPEHIFEALQYETGYPDNWQDLRNVIKKGGIDINTEAIERQIEVGVKLPKDIVEEFKNSKRYKELQKTNSSIVEKTEQLLNPSTQTEPTPTVSEVAKPNEKASEVKEQPKGNKTLSTYLSEIGTPSVNEKLENLSSAIDELKERGAKGVVTIIPYKGGYIVAEGAWGTGDIIEKFSSIKTYELGFNYFTNYYWVHSKAIGSLKNSIKENNKSFIETDKDFQITEQYNPEPGTQKAFEESIDEAIKGTEITQEQGDALKETKIEQAKAWAKRTGKTVADFFKKFSPTVSKGKDVNDLPKNALFQIIGQQGAEGIKVVKDFLATAKKMEADGVDAKTIFLATGWEKDKGDKGQWKYDLPDVKLIDSKLSEKVLALKESEYISKNISEVVSGELLSIYKGLKDLKVEFINKKNNKNHAEYRPSDYNAEGEKVKRIVINADKSSISRFIEKRSMGKNRELLQTNEGQPDVRNLEQRALRLLIIHELQHYVQEHRNAERRANMTPEERKSTMISESELLEGVRPEDKIYLYEGGQVQQSVEFLAAIDENTKLVNKEVKPLGRGLLTEKQANDLQKEIEDNYNNTGILKFGAANKDIRTNLFNFDNPVSSKTVNGVDIRIASGLVRGEPGKRYSTWLLYANGKIVGEFNDVRSAEQVVNFIEKNLIKRIGESATPIEVEKSENDKKIELLEKLTERASDKLKEVYDEKDFNKLQKLSDKIATDIYDAYLKENNIQKDERRYVNEGDLDMINQLSYRIISASDKKYGPIRGRIGIKDAIKDAYSKKMPDLPKGITIVDDGEGNYAVDQDGLNVSGYGSLKDTIKFAKNEFPVGTETLRDATSLDILANIDNFTLKQIVGILQSNDGNSEWQSEFNEITKNGTRPKYRKFLSDARQRLKELATELLTDDQSDEYFGSIEGDYLGEKKNTQLQTENDKAIGAHVTTIDGKQSAWIFDGAKPETLFHEDAHGAKAIIEDIADNALPEYKEQAVADEKTIQEFVGAKDRNWTREQHEKLANAIVKYMSEGIAPTKKLAAVFERIKQWLSNVWVNAREMDGIKLTPEVRAAFDRIYGNELLTNKNNKNEPNEPNSRTVPQGIAAYERGLRQGGAKNVEYSNLLRTGVGGTGKIKSAEEQENLVEDHAKEKGDWFGDAIEVEPQEGKDEPKLGKYIDSGTEAQVYVPTDNPTVVRKAMKISGNLNPDGTVADFLRNRISIHNIFPHTAPYTLLGFGRNEGGDLMAIVEQPRIEGARNATPKEIHDLYTSLGFKGKEGGRTYENDLYISTDVKPDNVLVDKKGNLHLIDTQFDTKEAFLTNKNNNNETTQTEQTTEKGTDQGGTNSGQSDSSEKIKTFKRRKKNEIKSPLFLKALSVDSEDPDTQVLQYFISGGKITTNVIEQIFGNKRGKNIIGEKRARIQYLGSGTKWQLKGYKKPFDTVKELAHYLWDNSSDEIQGKYEDTDFREAVERVISNYSSLTKMAEEVLRTSGIELDEEESAESKWYTQAYGSAEDFDHESLDEAIDILEGLTDAEIQEIIDNENNPQYIEAFIETWYGPKKEETVSEEDKIKQAQIKQIGDVLKVSQLALTKAQAKLKKATDQIAAKQAKQGNLLEQEENVTQKDLFANAPAEVKAVLDPLKTKVKQAEARVNSLKIQLDKLSETVDKNQQKLDLQEPKITDADKSNTALKGNKADVDEYIAKAKSVLAMLYPNAKLEVYATEKEYEDNGGEPGTRGYAIMGKNGNHRILLNLSVIAEDNSAKTAFHEAIHPIVYDLFGTDSEQLLSIWNQIAATMQDVPGMEKVFQHISNYGSDKIPVEGITEFLTQVAAGNINIADVPRSTLNKIIDLINKLFEALGINYKINSVQDFVEIANQIKQAFDGTSDAIKQAFKGESNIDKFMVAQELADADKPRVRVKVGRPDNADEEAVPNQILKSLMVEVPGSTDKIIKEYLSGGTIFKHTKEYPTNPQEYIQTRLEKAVIEGNQIVETAKAMYGDTKYVVKLLQFVKDSENAVNMMVKSLIYVSIENDLHLQKQNNPEMYETITNLQHLVHIEEQAFGHELSVALGIRRLKDFIKYGTIATPQSEILTPAENAIRTEMETAFEVPINEVDDEYEDEQVQTPEEETKEAEQKKEDAENEEKAKKEDKVRKAKDGRKKSSKKSWAAAAKLKHTLTNKMDDIADLISKLNC